MIRNVLYTSFLCIVFILTTPAYPNVISPDLIENYTLKVAKKFSKTYCNTLQFGISKDGALNFAIGETNKEFKNNKLNKLIDNKILNKKIIMGLSNSCQIYEFPVNELEKLAFD